MRNDDPLQDAALKIDRAYYHLKQLNDQIFEDGENNAHGVNLVHETETKELVARVLLPEDLFRVYSVIAGEVVHQARSALDHAVWALSVKPIKRVTRFPVCRNQGEYDDWLSGNQNRLSGAVIAILYSLQKFGPEQASDALYVLNELWNRDKHRTLNLCGVLPSALNLHQLSDGRWLNTLITIPPGLEHGAVFYRQPSESIVQMRAECGTTFEFRDGPFIGKPVAELLLFLVRFAEQVASALRDAR